MSDTHNITIRVSTTQLRAILEENPTALLDLERMAAEKIAEAIMKKLGPEKIDQHFSGVIARFTKSFNQSFESAWRLPPQAHEVIDKAAERAVGQKLQLATQETYRDLYRAFETKVRELPPTFTAEQIRQIATFAMGEVLTAFAQQSGPEVKGDNHGG